MSGASKRGAESGVELSPADLTESDAARFWSKVERSTGCWKWLAATWGQGYGYLWLNGKNVRAHRIAFVLGNQLAIPAGVLVCHTCDNRSCVYPDHLYLGSVADNYSDMIDRGPGRPPLPSMRRRARGERVGNSVLKEGQVREIRAICRRSDRTMADVGQQFGVSSVMVRKIAIGDWWAHVEGALSAGEWALRKQRVMKARSRRRAAASGQRATSGTASADGHHEEITGGPSIG